MSSKTPVSDSGEARFEDSNVSVAGEGAGNPLAVDLAGVRLQNPLIPASGCFGFGEEYLDFFDPNILGAAALKGTTVEPQDGNPTPRVAEAPCGMINSIGLQNPGLEAVLARSLPAFQQRFHQPVIMNISGFSVEEYVEACAETDGTCEIIEVNVSCPNVEGGGMTFGASADLTGEITRQVCEAVKHSKVFVKLSPNVTDIVKIAEKCVEGGADGLTLINTVQGMRIDVAARRPVIAREMGGLSGPAIFPIALRMIYQVKEAFDIPIMGSGGVVDARSAIEMMMAGANAIQIGSEALRNPRVFPQILEELPRVMADLGIGSLQEIVGAALPGNR